MSTRVKSKRPEAMRARNTGASRSRSWLALGSPTGPDHERPVQSHDGQEARQERNQLAE